MTWPDDARRETRAASAVIIGFSSRGGPGSSTTTWRVVIDPQTRARCRWDSRSTSPPSGTIACRRLLRGIGAVKPRDGVAPLQVLDECARSRASGRPSTSATTSRVTSSSVGPSPPHTTTRSASPGQSAARALSTARSSPATLLNTTSMPARVELLGDEQRVGVEPRRLEQLAADRDDRGTRQDGRAPVHHGQPPGGRDEHEPAQQQVAVHRRPSRRRPSRPSRRAWPRTAARATASRRRAPGRSGTRPARRAASPESRPG